MSSTDIRVHAVVSTAILHLLTADNQPMYAKTEDGEEDLSRPMTVELYGPGSREFKRAQANNNNRVMDRLKSKRKSDVSAEQAAEETAAFLAACTKRFNNISLDGLEGDALAKAIYTDRELGFIATQVNEFVNDWANFSKNSATK